LGCKNQIVSDYSGYKLPSVSLLLFLLFFTFFIIFNIFIIFFVIFFLFFFYYFFIYFFFNPKKNVQIQDKLMISLNPKAGHRKSNCVHLNCFSPIKMKSEDEVNEMFCCEEIDLRDLSNSELKKNFIQYLKDEAFLFVNYTVPSTPKDVSFLLEENKSFFTPRSVVNNISALLRIESQTKNKYLNDFILFFLFFLIYRFFFFFFITFLRKCFLDNLYFEIVEIL
jgi:Ca2+/Na+ antiporter